MAASLHIDTLSAPLKPSVTLANCSISSAKQIQSFRYREKILQRVQNIVVVLLSLEEEYKFSFPTDVTTLYLMPKESLL
jgi:hypothetical protein